MAKIEGIQVVIGADTSGLQRGVNSAQQALGKFASASRVAVLAVGKLGLAGVAAGFVAVAAGVSKVIAEADKMAKSAQKIGIMVEELSRLKYAADLSGVSFESLQTSVNMLNRSMAGIAAGNSNDASKAFDALGISVKNADGTMRSSSEVMSDIAEKFSQYEDGANKSAIAMAIFGRAGAAMIPMLNAGRDGLEAMKREADQLGIVIDGKTAKSAEQFNDNITRLTSVLNGIFVQITARTVPALKNITNAFVEVAKNGQSLEKMGESIAWVMQKIAHASLMGAELIQQFGRVFQAVAEASSKIARGEFGAAIAEFGKMNADIAQMEKKYSETLERLYKTRSAWEQNPPLPSDGFSGGRGQARQQAPNIGGSTDTAGTGDAAATDPLAAQREQIAQRLALIKEGFLSEQELLIQKYEDDRNIVDANFELQMEKFRGNKEMELQLTQEHNDTMQKLEEQHQDKLNQLRAAANATALNNLSTFFRGAQALASSNGDKSFKVAKAFAIAQGVMSTTSAAIQAMADPTAITPFQKFANYAAVLGKGLSAIASIRGMSSSGGGSAGAGAGGGGGAVASGGQAGGGGGTGGSSVYINLQGQTFGRDQVRDLVKQIADFQADGGQVVFA